MDKFGINPLFFIGVVEDRNDPRLEGRVKVRAFGFHGTLEDIPTEFLPWATLIIGNHSTSFTPPPLNAWVFGFFADGRDAQQPMILGLIPTQMMGDVSPSRNGFGAIASENHLLHSMGRRPEDYGQPVLPKAARGEYLEQTHLVVQDTNRVTNIKIAGSDTETWDEPVTAANPKYPFNNVLETAGGHVVELDDTPGAERVMIYHKAGSFIQIDQNGNTIIKSSNDATHITEGNLNTFVGTNGSARNTITIMGDSYFYVDGDRVEEVRGDLTQIVRGDYNLEVSGKATLNIADKLETRASKISMESFVEHTTLKSAQELRFTSVGPFHQKAQELFLEVSGSAVIKSDIFALQSGGSISLKADSINVGASGIVGISGSEVHMDDFIKLAEGLTTIPEDIEGEVKEAPSLSLKETRPKSVKTFKPGSRAYGSGGGASSTDEGSDMV